MKRSLAWCVLVLACVGCAARTPSSSNDAPVDTISANEAIAPDGEKSVAVEERKVIYDARMTIQVEDLATAQSQIPELVKQSGGYLANVDIQNHSLGQYTAQWTARIPVNQYDAFLTEVGKLGDVRSQSQSAQDVTAEFVDHEARIASKKQLEARILGLLEQPNGEIRDVIEVEHELARVRSEIEQMQGQLKYLANRTSFATVTLDVEVKPVPYIPPTPPNFFAQVSMSWKTSWLNLKYVAQQLTIIAVGLLPPVLVLCGIGVPLWFLFCLVSPRFRRC